MVNWFLCGGVIGVVVLRLSLFCKCITVAWMPCSSITLQPKLDMIAVLFFFFCWWMLLQWHSYRGSCGWLWCNSWFTVSVDSKHPQIFPSTNRRMSRSCSSVLGECEFIETFIPIMQHFFAVDSSGIELHNILSSAHGILVDWQCAKLLLGKVTNSISQ